MRSKAHSEFNVIAVAGTSDLGTQIRLELSKSTRFHSILALRREQDEDDHESADALTVRVNYQDSALHEKLQGVDVLISTLGGREGLLAQRTLAQAAKRAGVKLFIPSEFTFEGLVEDGLESAFKIKADLRAFVQEIGLPSCFVHSGLRPEVFFHKSSSFGFDADKHTAQIVGDGSTPVSWTTSIDVARFLSHILEEHDQHDLAGKSLYIEGDRKSLKEIVEIFERLSKQKWTIADESADELSSSLRNAAGGQDRFLDLIKLAIAKGVARHEEALCNDMYPRWHPTVVEEQLRTMYTFES